MSDDDSKSPTGASSLQHTSTLNTINEILSDLNPEATFFALDEFPQRLLFRQMAAEHRRLLEVEKTAKTWEKWCPSADRQLWSQRWDRIQYHEDDDDPQNGHRLLNNFFSEWQVKQNGEGTQSRDPYVKPAVKWIVYDLFKASPDSPLKVQSRSTCDDTDLRSPPARLYLWDLISAQLLLYRVSSIFELFPTKEGIGNDCVDGYKSSWGVTLERVGDKSSEIQFEDYKGGAHVRYEGSEEGSVEALKLIEFLISNNIPLAYDGTIAGTVA